MEEETKEVMRCKAFLSWKLEYPISVNMEAPDLVFVSCSEARCRLSSENVFRLMTSPLSLKINARQPQLLPRPGVIPPACGLCHVISSIGIYKQPTHARPSLGREAVFGGEPPALGAELHFLDTLRDCVLSVMA